MRLLVVKTSSMGDVVHALPLVSDIAAALPGTVIDWVVEEGFADIARLHPSVARVIPVALRRWRRELLKSDMWAELGVARRSLRDARYDAALDCQGLLKSAWVARWARCPVFGFDRASAREPLAARLYARSFAVDRQQHAIARNRALGGAALGYAVQGAPHFGLRPAALANELRPLAERPYAAILSNASRPTKLLPDAHWHAIAADFAQRGLRTLLFWGGAVEQQATLRRARPMQDAIVAPRLSLAAVAPLLAGARLVAGLDTGLTHLAAALGVPTVGIYCDYDPRLVGVTGDAPCESVGDASGPPPVADVLAALDRVNAAARHDEAGS